MLRVPFQLRPGKPESVFYFNIRAVRRLEQRSGVGIDLLRARFQAVEVLVLLVTFGLRHAEPNLTEEQAEDYIQAFIENGGDTMQLLEAVDKALSGSGVYGRPKNPTQTPAKDLTPATPKAVEPVEITTATPAT